MCLAHKKTSLEKKVAVGANVQSTTLAIAKKKWIIIHSVNLRPKNRVRKWKNPVVDEARFLDFWSQRHIPKCIFHGPGLVRPHDLEFYRCWPKFVQIDSSQLCLDLQALRNLESIQNPLHYVQLQNSTTLSKLDCVHKFPPSLLWKLKVIFFNSTMKFPPFFLWTA